MVHIIGAGIAGLLLAEALSKKGKKWCVYERAATVGAEASGKTAGIIRTYEADPVIAAVARASLAYYIAHEPSFRKTGILLRPWEVDYALEDAPVKTFSHGRFSGFLLEDNGTLEPMETLQRLAQNTLHGLVRYNAEMRLELSEGGVTALVDTLGGERITVQKDDQVVIAAGEGAPALSVQTATPLGLISHQRSLYEYHNTTAYRGPVEWDEESGCYFRPCDETLIATAGEQIPVEPRLSDGEAPVKSEKSLAAIAAAFPFLNPQQLKSYRTCRRTMPLDNRPYCGADQNQPGVFWFTGFGGRGISIAPALAEALSAALNGETPGFDLAPFSPARQQ